LSSQPPTNLGFSSFVLTSTFATRHFLKRPPYLRLNNKYYM
jgi:hypothetical protein